MTSFVLIAALIAAAVLVYVTIRTRSGPVAAPMASRWFVVPEGASDDVQQRFAGVLAIHAALLSTGQIIYFGGDEHDGTLWQNRDVDHTRLFDCATLQVDAFNPGSPAGSPPTDLFCCGHAMLGDGKLLVAGGTEFFVQHAEGKHHDHMPGLRDASVYDPLARAWSRIGSMIDPFPRFPNQQHEGRPEGGRWYPTLLTIYDGSILALSGHPSNQDDRHNNHIPERYVPFLASWVALSEPSPLFEISDDTRLYPRVHLLPNGLVFCSTPLGTEPRNQTIDPMTGLRRFAGAAPPRDTVTGDRALIGPFGDPIAMPNGVYWGNSFTQCATSVLLPLVPPHYAPRVLICGGQTAHVIDLQALMNDPAAEPQWTAAGTRAVAEPRFHLNAVLMPTGDVFVSGGCRAFNQDKAADNVPEIYHPETNDWESLSWAPATVVRNYHSVALLMPDGRIWTAGSDRNGGQGFEASAELRIEIFEPGYARRPDRPRILSAPDVVMCGDTFEVETADAASIGRVAVIRAGSVTHSFNSDQRYIVLDFRRSGDTRLSVTAPPNSRIAPPGSYLLFLLDTEGVPSEGRFVRIGMHQQHVFYRNVTGGIEHIFWDEPTSHLYSDNWTARVGEIAAVGEPATMVTPGQQHVFYRAADGSIRHIFWDAGARQLFHDNWTARAGAPLAFGDPATMVTPHQQHVFYRTRAGAMHHVLWDDRTASGFFHDDWTARAGAPLAAGDPATMLTPHQQHIFYRTVEGAIHHILWDDRTANGFFHDDWTARAGAPLAAGDPSTMITPDQQHIFYRTTAGAIHHILWDDRAPNKLFHDDWTQRAGAPLAAGDPATMVTANQQHVFYRTQAGAIHHILWDDRTKNGFFHDDWTARAGAPAAVAGPATLVTPHQQHVFYQGPDGAVDHILWDEWTENFFHDDWTAGAAVTDAERAAGRPATLLTRL